MIALWLLLTGLGAVVLLCHFNETITNRNFKFSVSLNKDQYDKKSVALNHHFFEFYKDLVITDAPGGYQIITRGDLPCYPFNNKIRIQDKFIIFTVKAVE